MLKPGHGGTTGAPEEAETQFPTRFRIDGRSTKFQPAGNQRCEDQVIGNERCRSGCRERKEIIGC